MIQKLLASEPVRLIVHAIGIAIGGALYAVLPADYKWLALPVAGGVVSAGEAARKLTYSANSHGEAVAATGVRIVEDLQPDDLVPGAVIPITTAPKVEDIATQVVGRAGGIAGKLAQDAVGRILSAGTDRITARLRRGKLRRG